MNRYFDLNEEQKLALSNDEILTAVKLEAVNRGIKPPVVLENALQQCGFKGFTLPSNAVIFYELCAPGEYSHSQPKRTGVAFKTPEAARKALEGAVGIVEVGYGATKKNKICDSDFTVIETYVTFQPPSQFAAKLEEFQQDNEAFDKLCEECRVDLSGIQQKRYDAQVRSQKRKSYLELAQGNEEIASAFWRKTEQGDFPTE